MGHAKKTRSSTSMIPAPQMATSPTVPSGIGPSDTAASPLFHILPTIPSGISGNSPIIAPIVAGGRGEHSPSIGPAAVTSNANSCITVEEIEDPEASTSSLSNEQ
ncbi:hypothetical protein C8J56DRAFT_1042146 [Mycena floridula]|nr:hypothetical protein C8J56DRAFT_1042146 [Mycena floridula]